VLLQQSINLVSTEYTYNTYFVMHWSSSFWSIFVYSL